MSSGSACRLHFDTEITSLDQLGEADLIVGANGAFSSIRSENEARFGTTTDWRPNKFIWYGTTKAFDSLTLTFRETGAGVFCAHHYRYRPDMQHVPGRGGDAHLEARRFRDDERGGHDPAIASGSSRRTSGGHPIISNNSVLAATSRPIWNERWSFDNVVLVGDALRTAHFSIGSGTRLAMEDAVALFKAFKEIGTRRSGGARALPAEAPAADEEDLGCGQREPALVRRHGPSGHDAQPGGVRLQLHDAHRARRSCRGPAPRPATWRRPTRRCIPEVVHTV